MHDHSRSLCHSLHRAEIQKHRNNSSGEGRLHHEGEACTPATRCCVCSKRGWPQSQNPTEQGPVRMGLKPRAATCLLGAGEVHCVFTAERPSAGTQGVCPTLLRSCAVGFHFLLSHLCCTSVPKQKKFTLQLRFQCQAKVPSPGEVLGSPAWRHLHRFMAGAHAPLSFPTPSESHPGQSRHAAGDMDVRHQMAQVCGPCVIAEEKAAQRHNAGQGQHQDSPKRARRLSKHCPQCRWDAFPTLALMQRLRPAPPIPFAAGGQHRHPNIPRHVGVQGS